MFSKKRSSLHLYRHALYYLEKWVLDKRVASKEGEKLKESVH